ncbi:glycosyltransferase family 39 protein [Patescibacteria group bacterium]|nr:glycosyltransferase family 39 protein [Patescibacteria group bacterium]
MKKLSFVLLIGICVAAFAVRLYRINNPVADWHSWRQSDTAAVARNFLTWGIDPLHPRFEDLSNIPSGKDNPMGWRMVEFPVYQVIGAWATKTMGFFPVEVWLRLVTICASVGAAILLYSITAGVSDRLTGMLAAAVYAALPYSIYYGRTILPDTFMVWWSLLSLWLLLRAFKHTSRVYWVLLLLSALSASVAFLVKPFAGFLLVPAGYLFLKRFSLTRHWIVSIIVFTAIALYPLLWWRTWILQYPEGIPAYTWLFNGGGIRFKGAWFYWLFAERIGNLILGYWGLVPFGIGLLLPHGKKEGWFFRWWLLGALSYLIVIARGNVQHDYYQIVIVPVIAAYVAKGLAWIFRSGTVPRITGAVAGTVCILFMLAFSWYTVRGYFWINHPEIVAAGRVADAILPPDAKVIAPYNGDTTFLYQTHRQGWPIGFDIAKKMSEGAGYYVTVSPTDADLETKELAAKYTVLVRNDKYAIIDLTRLKGTGK